VSDERRPPNYEMEALTMAHDVTFGMLGSVIFDMTMAGGPVPPGLHSPRVESFVTVTCTEEQARAMEHWLRAPEQESPEYRTAAEVIRRTLEAL